MWQIKDPEIKPTTLDFRSSGQSSRQAHQLCVDGIELINALELVDWDSKDTQFLICEACGYTHCKPGDWVSVRKSDSLILILPAADYVWGQGNDKNEYSPPPYLKKRGVAYLDVSTYEHLRSMNSSIPGTEKIRTLSLREAALLFQWEAPHKVLGEPPELNIRRDIVVGSSEGTYVEHLQQMENLIKRQYEDESCARLRSMDSNERVISFYLDGAEFIEWKAMVFDGSEYRLLIDSTHVVSAAR